MNEVDILTKVREAAEMKILFLPHAVSQMSREDRMISPVEVEKVVTTGEIIENYPEDKRGHSCLMLGWVGEDRPLHVVCSPKEDYLAIITAYLPDAQTWTSDFRRRI